MLNVYWAKKDIFGRLKVRDNMGEYVQANICRSNALLTSVVAYYEYEPTTKEKTLCHTPWWWFADKEYLKNCLGLNKGFNNILKGEIVEITLIHTAPKEIKTACLLLAKTLEINLLWLDDIDEYVIDEVSNND